MSPPANPPASLSPNLSPQLACIEMDSTFYDVLKLKTAIKKVFLSTLACSLFWNTFLSVKRGGGGGGGGGGG